MSSLIDNYLYQVGRKLAPSTRADILDELRANIQDEFEQKSDNQQLMGNEKQSREQEILEGILIGLGSPEHVASGYSQNQRALVAPGLLEVYWSIIKYTLMGISIAFVVIGAIELAFSTFSVQEITRFIAGALTRIWSAGLSAFGMITLVFILVTKSQDDDDLTGLTSKSEKVWNKQALYALKPQPASQDVVKQSDAIGSLIGVVIGFLILNGLTYGSGGNLWMAWIDATGIETTRLAFVSTSLLKSFMPYINLVMAASFTINLTLLIKGKWQLKLRIAHMAEELVGLGLFLGLWLNPSFFDLNAAKEIVGESVVEALKLSLNITSVIVLIIVCGATIATIYKHLKAILKRD